MSTMRTSAHACRQAPARTPGGTPAAHRLRALTATLVLALSTALLPGATPPRRAGRL